MDRTVGINTGHVGTSDFTLEEEDRSFVVAVSVDLAWIVVAVSVDLAWIKLNKTIVLWGKKEKKKNLYSS